MRVKSGILNSDTSSCPELLPGVRRDRGRISVKHRLGESWNKVVHDREDRVNSDENKSVRVVWVWIELLGCVVSYLVVLHPVTYHHPQYLKHRLRLEIRQGR